MKNSGVLAPVLLTAAVAGVWLFVCGARSTRRPTLKQMQSLVYPAPSGFPLHTRNHGNVYSSTLDQHDTTQNSISDGNSSSLHRDVDIDNAPLRHPEQQFGIRITDGNANVVYDANNALKPKAKRETSTGFAVKTWDYAHSDGAEIVYLGKGFLFERFPMAASGGDGTLRLANGQEKVSTPFLPYLDWAGNRKVAVYTPSGSGRFITYDTTNPTKPLHTRSIQYLSATGEKRTMTSVPTPSRYDAPTVKTTRGSDTISDFPLVFRVWRQTEPTLLDTDKLHVLNWNHEPIMITITAGRQFQWRRAIDGKPLGVPKDYFDYLSMTGEKLRARIRIGNEMTFRVEDTDTTIGGTHNSITFLGPREEAFTVRLIPLRDSLEMGKTHLL